MEDGTVTLRERDTMSQERVPLGELSSLLEEKIEAWTPLERVAAE